jgi:hypothetical protein
MPKLVTRLTLSVLCYLCAGVGAVGQTTPPAPRTCPSPRPTSHEECKNQEDPFASYCEDVYNFLDEAACHHLKDEEGKDTGKLDRINNDVWSAMKPFLDLSGVFGAGSVPTRFTSLRARDIALENALGAISSGENQGRPDQQTTARSNSIGTTSLVTKAGAPAILAFALESGALTQSVSGNTSTMSANADGLFRALTGQQVLCFSCPNALGTPALRSISFSATFLVDQHSTPPITTSGAANSSTPIVTSVVVPTSAGKLSSFTARYEFRNRFDPRDGKFRESWETARKNAKSQIDDKAKALQTDLESLLDNSSIKSDVEFQKLLENYRETFYNDAETGNATKLRQDFLDLYDATVATLSKDDPQFDQRATQVNLSLAQYKALWEQLLQDARGKPLLTFEYAFNRPVNQPETHDFRFVYGYAPKSAVGLFSLNAAISIYGGTIPMGARYGRLHDGQISAEYDRPFTVKNNPNQATFSLAGYWQYQPDPSVLNITAGNLVPGTGIDLPGNAQVLLGTSGSLWVTQAKLTINGKSGIKVPFAVKWSNKTDLLAGKRLGAQVGISYDFSSLSSLFGGSSGQ